MQKHTHTTKRTHGHDGKDKMVIVATLWDTDGRAIEDTTMNNTRKVFENQVHAYSDKDGDGTIDDLKSSRPYIAFVKKALGGAPDGASPLMEQADGFRWYTRATGDGGTRILQVIPAVYGETEEQVKADPAAAVRRAQEHPAVAGPVGDFLSALMSAGLCGSGAAVPDLFGDFDDEGDLFDDEY